MASVFAAFALVVSFAFASHAADKSDFRSFLQSQSDSLGKPYTWTGFYVGGNVGYQFSDIDLDLAVKNGGSLGVDGLSADGWRYGLRAGFDWQPNSSPFVIGVFAGYDWGESDFSVNIVGVDIAKAKLEPTWHIGARAGIVLAESTLIYVGYAFGQADFNAGLNQNIVGPVCSIPGVKCSGTLDGHTFIAGTEMRLSDNFTTALEYNYTQYDSIALFSGKNGVLKADPDAHAVMLRVNWRPNFGL